MATPTITLATWAFDGRNPAAVKAAQRQAATLVTSTGLGRLSTADETRQAIRDLIADSIGSGINPYQVSTRIQEMVGLNSVQADAADSLYERLVNSGLSMDAVDDQMSRYVERAVRQRADTIARSEIMEALQTGELEAQQQAQDEGFLNKGAVKVWRTSGLTKNPPCPVCQAMNNRYVLLDEQFTLPDKKRTRVDTAHAHPNCLPGYVCAMPVGAISATTERYYRGNLVILRTSAGKKLSCTPNHPILTDTGWFPAGLLNTGNYVVGLSGSNWEAMIHDHHQHVPTSIKEIARSFSDSTAARLSTVKVSAEDFHGDGSGSDVAVIRTNGLLGDSGEAALVQQRSKKSLSVILDAIRLAPGGSSEQCIESGVRTAHGGVGGSYLAGALCGHHALPLNGLALALVAQANAARAQGAPDFVAMSGVSDGESERENGFPGEVALDEISSIKVCPFEGHVYNLQTTSRLYIGNGLIVHNCRCNARILPEPPDNATPNTGDEEIDEE